MPTTKEMYKQAEQLYASGQIAEAVAQLDQLLAQDSQHVLSHLALSKWLLKLSRFDEAVQHAQLACRFQPEDPFNFTALSVTCQQAFEGTRNTEFIRMAEEAKEMGRQARGGHHPH